MAKNIQTENANFRVGSKGLVFRLSNRKTAAFFPGDPIRIANLNKEAVVEMRIGGKRYGVRIPEKHLKSVLEKVNHPSEFKRESLEFMRAFTQTDIPTEKLIRAFGEAVKNGQRNRAQKTLTLERRIRKMAMSEKAQVVLESPSRINTPSSASIRSIDIVANVPALREQMDPAEGDEDEVTEIANRLRREQDGMDDEEPTTEEGDPTEEPTTEGDGTEDDMTSEADDMTDPTTEMDGEDDLTSEADGEEDPSTTEADDTEDDTTTTEQDDMGDGMDDLPADDEEELL